MHDTNSNRLGQSISVAVAALVVLSMGAGVASAAGTTDLSVSAGTETLAPGETTTVEVVLDTADGGVGSGQLQASLTDPSVAEITDITVGNDPGTQSDPIFEENGSAVQAAYAFDDTNDTGSVTVAEVTVEAKAEGSTDVELSAPPDIADGSLTFGDESGASYVLDSVGSTTLTVEATNQPPAADAGSDQTVAASDTVSLDGSESSDPDAGDSVSYQWVQTGDGPPVSLSDDTAAQPTFTAPSVDSAATLEFELRVSDDSNATDTDTVNVTVEPPAAAQFQVSGLSAPDAATQGDSIDVSADVENTGGQTATETVEFRVDSDGDGSVADEDAVVSQDLELAPGESTTVTFESVDTSGLPAGTLTHGVVTTDDTATASITVDAPSDADPGASTAVSLSPDEDLVAVNGTTTFDVVVQDADGGVGAYSLTVSADGEAATIENVSVDESALSDVAVSADGTSATVDAALLDTEQSGSVTVATVTVAGVADGEAEVGLDVDSLGTESGDAYEVTAETGAELTVSELVVGSSEQPALDPDGDDVYEDVNGDGNVTVVDVQLLFAERNGATVQESPAAFDFNGDGEFDILDVQSLYFGEVAPSE
jgi:hypothetical protein